jgi:Fe-S-cluster containining protein
MDPCFVGVADTLLAPTTAPTAAPTAALDRLIADVSARHLEASVRAASLAAASGLACPPGCGRCCLSPGVESSVADCLPAARALFDRGDAHALHARLAGGADARCVLYAPAAPDDETRGRCGLYEHRPSICRAFGFAARRARAGGLELATCKELRRESPAAVARAAEAVAAGLDAPRIDVDPTDVALLAGADARPLPINQALRLAIERVGMERALRASTAAPDHAPAATPLALVETPTDGDEPRTPRRPSRAA